MSAFGTHRELAERKGWQDVSCDGRMLGRCVGGIWELECETCGFPVGVHEREVDPALHQVQLIERRREQSGIPEGLRGLQLPTGSGAAERAAWHWAHGQLRGLLLTGSVGVGKTHTAAAAAWERATRETIRWLSVPVLFTRLGRSFGDEEREGALAVLSGEQALVLDDLDKTRPSEFAAEQLFVAIDSRVTAGAGLLVTTNLALSALADRYPYGEAIVSRLAGYCEAFQLIGPDRRVERFAA